MKKDVNWFEIIIFTPVFIFIFLMLFVGVPMILYQAFLEQGWSILITLGVTIWFVMALLYAGTR